MTAAVLQDILTRLIRLREANEDGEIELVEAISDDLERDLRRWIRHLQERER